MLRSHENEKVLANSCAGFGPGVFSNRNGLGRWANTASGVAIPGAVGGAAELTAVNQTGDTANAQVRGLSFVNEFERIHNP